jgi:hypothetical protein
VTKVTSGIARHGSLPQAPAAARAVIVVLTGLAVGVATSVLQQYLDSPWLALVNAASPWLVPAFVVGAMERWPLPAAVAGLATCVLEVAGYYVTTSLRGFAVSTAFIGFWGVCAVLGGPLFGVAGCLWRSGSERLRGLGATAVPAAFISEGVIAYGLRLGYTSSMVLFVLLGVAALVLLGVPGRRLASAVGWLLPVLALGIVAQLALGLVYTQSFTHG